MEQKLLIYNTLTRTKERFTPLHAPNVGMYVCGPTVYGDPHLGHARPAITFDILFRYLKHLGYKVRYVRNITDVGHLEHDAAKDEQRDIEAQIAELEEILKNAEIIQDEAGGKKSNKVKMESVVKLHDVEYDEDIEYVIVGSSEADSLNNKISNESPLGAALIGKKVGDTVKVEAPVGEIEYKIIEVKN